MGHNSKPPVSKCGSNACLKSSVNSALKWNLCRRWPTGASFTKGTLKKKYCHWISWVLRCSWVWVGMGVSLWKLFSEAHVELADLLQHNLQLLSGRQDGHPGQKEGCGLTVSQISFWTVHATSTGGARWSVPSRNSESEQSICMNVGEAGVSCWGTGLHP